MSAHRIDCEESLKTARTGCKILTELISQTKGTDKEDMVEVAYEIAKFQLWNDALKEHFQSLETRCRTGTEMDVAALTQEAEQNFKRRMDGNPTLYKNHTMLRELNDKLKTNEADELAVMSQAEVTIDPLTKQPLDHTAVKNTCNHSYNRSSIDVIMRSKGMCVVPGCGRRIEKERLIADPDVEWRARQMRINKVAQNSQSLALDDD